MRRETRARTPCARRGKGFTPGRSQGWLWQEMFSLLLKPGRESCLSTPQPVVLQLRAGEGAGRSPARPAPPAEWGALFPNTAVPCLICAPAPSDAQWGDLSKKKKWVKQCREAHGAKAVSDAPRRFEEELGRELSAGTSDKGALVPRGGDVAGARDAQGVRAGA